MYKNVPNHQPVGYVGYIYIYKYWKYWYIDIIERISLRISHGYNQDDMAYNMK